VRPPKEPRTSTGQRVALTGAGVGLLVIGFSAFVGWVGADSGFDWELAAVFGTAAGTTLLAVATGALAYLTWGDVRATREQATISREALQESYRPLIVDVPPGLPGNDTPVTVRYVYGYDVHEVEVADIASPDVVQQDDGAIRLSLPFRNVGNGVALLTGMYLRTAFEDPNPGGGQFTRTVPPGEIGRTRMFLPDGYPNLDGAFARGEGIIFGILYTDVTGQRALKTEIEVVPDDTGQRVANRTVLFIEGVEAAATA
jgi:hypothetical protein